MRGAEFQSGDPFRANGQAGRLEVFGGCLKARLELALGGLDELAEGSLEPAPPDLRQRQRQLAAGDPRSVGRDQIEGRDRTDYGATAFLGVEHCHQLPPKVLRAPERSQLTAAEQRRRGRIGAEKERSARLHHTVEDEVVDRQVVAS